MEIRARIIKFVWRECVTRNYRIKRDPYKLEIDMRYMHERL